MISKLTLTYLLLSLVLTINAQTQKFSYKAESKLHSNRVDITSTRTYLNDTVFTDNGLLCASDTAISCAITFKKIKSTWFVKADGQWQEFFNPVDGLIKVIYFKNEKFILKPTGHSMEYNGVSLHGFIKEELYVYTSHKSILWFDPNLGVVIIEGDEQLVRQDFNKDKGK